MLEQTGRIFFGNSWIDKKVQFTDPQPSIWRIRGKYSENVQQFDSLDLETIGGPKLSYSEVIFICENVNNTTEEAFLKVYKQIPHVATEDEPHTIRAQQAGNRTFCDIEAYKKFAAKAATHLPICLAHKTEHQDNYDLVPTGFIEYMVYTKFLGLRLSKEKFWSLDGNEREEIRQSFVPAFNEMWSIGLKPWLRGIHLIWHKGSKKVYIIDFTVTYPMEPEADWNDFLFASWGLAIPPKSTKGMKSGVTSPDTSNWKF